MKYALGLVVVAACSSDATFDLTGMYQVTADVESMPCGTDQPVVMPPAYLRFQKMMFGGLTYFTYDECNDAAGTDCPNTGSLFSDSYVVPVSNGWTLVEKESSSSGGNCTLTYIEGSALVTSGQLAIEHNEWSDNVQLPDAQCTTTEAGNRGKTMPCVDHYHIDATKL